MTSEALPLQDNVQEKAKRGNSLFNARNVSFVILAIAILISGYLSYLKVVDVPAVCIKGSNFDCGTVLNSIYSEVANIPIAWLGLATNLIVVGLLLLENRIEFLQDYGKTLIFAVVLFAFIFSMYLIYVQAALIQAFCPWCLTHEALITLLFIVSSWRLWKEMRAEG